MGLTAAHDERAPLTGRGPSRDQPAPGSRRHIPAGSPEPPRRVRVVAVLEQQPAYERWERLGPNRWRHAGYRGRMLATPDDGRTVSWDQVGICAHSGRHDMKDVTDRSSDWADRPTDVLPERPHDVELEVTATGDAAAAVEELRDMCDDVIAKAAGGGRIRLRFHRYSTTLMSAINSAAHDAETVGLDVVAVNT